MAADLARSLAMLAVFALFAGGAVTVVRRPGERRRAVLMIVCALVLLANILLWTL